MASEIGPVVFELDSAAAGTLHEQLEQGIREQIRSGALPAGTKLPSTRGLARELGISRGVVLEAYSQLIAEGYLVASQGAPTRVAPTASAERPPIAARSLHPRHAYHFDPEAPDLLAFPRHQWLRSLRAALRSAPADALGEGDPRGAPQLRDELMAYLTRVRGAAPEPEHTIVCSGFLQAFTLLCRSLRERGLDRIAVEEPCRSSHRLAAESSGLEPVPINVDERGIDVGELARSGCETVVLTPAHQFPTGAVLASERRSALLEWAEDNDALIVEDDYDSELRYDRVPVGALQGLAPERVCQIGSLSIRLAPAVSLGWMLSPSWLSGALTYEQGVAGGLPPVVDQLGLAAFISGGELDRHLRRMRARYRSRRRALIDALARMLPAARPAGIPAGVFTMVHLPAEIDEHVLVRAAAARGVGVEAGASALVLGFGNLPEPAIERGVSQLAQAAGALAGV